MYSKILVGQVHFENFDFLVKVKGPLGQSIFSLFFFFFFLAGGSDPSQIFGSAEQTGQTWVVEDDIIHDVIAL